MADITFKNLHKVYEGNITAVTNFNLHIQDNEFVVFVGPSGCGKSTTLRMIAGLEDITKGELYIGNELVNHVPPKDRDIAMVFQNYALYPHMNVYDNMAFGLKLRKFSKKEIDERVQNTANILGLREMLNRKPEAMSGGQRQRVALGRAIVRNPKVFLMDEPLSNLDAKLRVQMRTEIGKLHERLQTTTIYVTHDQTEAMTMASRIVVMKDGLIQQVGEPKEIYNLPHNVFVGSFIGSPPMNFLKGILKDDFFHIGEHKLKIPAGKRASILPYNNNELILGIRPENIHADSTTIKTHNDSTFEVTIDVAELLGAESYLYSTIDHQDFVARIDGPRKISNGEKISLALDMDKVLFFDPGTELRIK